VLIHAHYNVKKDMDNKTKGLIWTNFISRD